MLCCISPWKPESNSCAENDRCLYCTQCPCAHPHVCIHTNAVHITQPYELSWSPHRSRVKEGNSNSSRAAPQSSMIYSPCMMGHMYISYYMSWNVLDVWASPCLHTRFFVLKTQSQNKTKELMISSCMNKKKIYGRGIPSLYMSYYYSCAPNGWNNIAFTKQCRESRQCYQTVQSKYVFGCLYGGEHRIAQNNL